MKIELNVEEYFNKLKQIENVYAQEEALYPWIFILLSMAEIKKRDKKDEQYKKVDIISVAGAKYGKDLSEDELSVRKQLTEYVGTPDIAIIGDGRVLGCVEAKKISYNLFTEGYDVPAKIDFPKKLKKTNIYEGKTYGKGKEKKPVFLWRYKDIQIKKLLQDKNEYAPHQLLSHLQKFNKVIYTNGLDFFYLTLKQEEMKKVISIESLASLSDSYVKYKGISEKPSDANSKEITDELSNLIFEATEEWEKLLDNLSEKDWFESETGLNFLAPEFIIQDEEGKTINECIQRGGNNDCK